MLEQFAFNYLLALNTLLCEFLMLTTATATSG